MKNVYKLVPEYKDYLWGGEKLKTDYGKQTDKTPCAESWELSLNPHGLTKVEDGKTLAEVLRPKKPEKTAKNLNFFPYLSSLSTQNKICRCKFIRLTITRLNMKIHTAKPNPGI